MNRQEKESYLREYEVLKKKGKPFFPYAVMKDSVMALVVVIVIAVMALFLGAEHPEVAELRSNLGLIYEAQGDLRAARRAQVTAYDRALSRLVALERLGLPDEQSADGHPQQVVAAIRPEGGGGRSGRQGRWHGFSNEPPRARGGSAGSVGRRPVCPSSAHREIVRPVRSV